MSLLQTIKGRFKMNIQYEKLNHSNFESVTSELSRNFSDHELITRTLKIKSKEIYALFYPIVKNSFIHSYVARNLIDNKIIGAIICNDVRFFTDDLSYEGISFSTELQGVMSFLSTLENQYIQENLVIENTHLYQYATYVDIQYRGKGVATELYKLSEEGAKNSGFKKIITISTGLVSQHIRINKLKFAIEHELDYQSFSFLGKFIFKTIDEVNSCKLFVKKLS